MLSCPGGEHSVDTLEAIMYNAVSAAVAEDGRGVQTMQQANQVMLSRELRFPFMGDDANLFTLSDRDSLCALVNAWPRFIQHQWMLTRDDGLCAMSYAPCTVRYRLGSATVRLSVESQYPSSGSVRIGVRVSEPAAFPISLRIPAYAKGASAAVGGDILSAKEGEFLTINREWHDGDEILLTLPMPVRIATAYHQAVSITRGPLTFAYVPETAEGVSEEGYKLLAAKKGFGVALTKDVPIEAEVSGCDVVLHAQGVRIPEWGMRGPSCDQPPLVSAGSCDNVSLTLAPYAKSAIRLAVLPIV
jgi:hypothetical protein